MRLLFVIRNHGYLRNYASTLEQLAQRGHTIWIGSGGPERHIASDSAGFAERLTSTYPGIRVQQIRRRKDRWAALAATVRAYRNALRYRHPRYASAVSLRERARKHLERWSPWLSRYGVPPLWPAASVLSRAAAAVEAVIPADPRVDAYVEKASPDAVLVTPLVDFNSSQADIVKSARKLGIPSALCVASWDNLTNKGVIPVRPDRVFVWNEFQRREAIELHGIEPADITVTGAQLFDDWFARRPKTSREFFCQRVGLAPDRPFLLYLCSSLFISGSEVEFVRRWIGEIRRSSHARLKECGILIRPHPGNAGPWNEADLAGLSNVAIWPRQGALPLDEDEKAGYFDSLSHSAAVVGLNTTGFIEAGIARRRSFTLLLPEHAATQTGTLHFDYLVKPGYLMTATSLAEHCAQLANELDHPSPAEVFESFLTGFVRPFGLDQPATPRLVEAIEALATTGEVAVRGRSRDRANA